MKAKKTVLAVLAAGFIMFGFMAAIPAQAYTIIVYGADWCGYTQSMRDDLTAAKYNFTYYDVTKNDAKLDEMWVKVKLVCPACSVQGSVKMPVLDLNNGTIKIRPSFEEVKGIVGNP